MIYYKQKHKTYCVVKCHCIAIKSWELANKSRFLEKIIFGLPWAVPLNSFSPIHLPARQNQHCGQPNAGIFFFNFSQFSQFFKNCHYFVQLQLFLFFTYFSFSNSLWSSGAHQVNAFFYQIFLQVFLIFIAKYNPLYNPWNCF
jgi:hypothetical protein